MSISIACRGSIASMRPDTARFYDAIYQAVGKDYRAEATRLIEIIRDHTRSSGQRLLDVACGTGAHAEYFGTAFDVTGVDLEPAMLEIARERCPDATFVVGDMRDVDLGETFDAVVCLFSSIGMMKSEHDLDAAIGNMARHVAPGGVLVIEPWIFPDQFESGRLHTITVDEERRKIVRVTRAVREGDLAILDMQYLIATPQRIDHVAERFELGLFDRDQYERAMRLAGLAVTFDAEGLFGRGLFIAMRSGDEAGA
jgi:ubiquinone/menaquinone biosynthesis C-methylase UbiE